MDYTNTDQRLIQELARLVEPLIDSTNVTADNLLPGVDNPTSVLGESPSALGLLAFLSGAGVEPEAVELDSLKDIVKQLIDLGKSIQDIKNGDISSIKSCVSDLKTVLTVCKKIGILPNIVDP